MSTIANLKINIITSTAGMTKGFGRATKSLAKFRKRLNSAFGGLAKMGFVAAAAGIGILIVATKKMISVFSEFESKMQEVRSILLDIGDKTFARLTAQARKLGSTTVFTASEAAEAMSFLARAGFDVNEVMAATPALLDLAAAANMNLAETADITTQVIRGMGIEATEAGRVVDVLAFASARTNTTVSQLGSAFGYVAPVASALGITLEETAAMLGVLSNAGMKADRAGTGLKNIFAELAGEIDRNGISALKKFTEGGIGVEEAFDIFQKRGGPAILALAKMHKTTAKLVEEMQDVEGVARKMADIRMDSVQGAFKLLWSVVQELNIMIGERLRGTIRNIQEVLRRVVVGFTKLAKVMMDKFDLASFTVENMLGGLSKVLKWLEDAWDGASRFGAAILYAFNTLKAALSGIILGVLMMVNTVAQPVLLLLRLFGTITKKEFTAASTVMTESVKNAAKAVRDAADESKKNFVSIFEEANVAASRFVDSLITKIKSVGNTPIILTMESGRIQVPDKGDISDITNLVKNQTAALQEMVNKMISGGDEDEGEFKSRLEKRKTRLEALLDPYTKAVELGKKSLSKAERLLIRQRELEEKITDLSSGSLDDFGENKTFGSNFVDSRLNAFNDREVKRIREKIKLRKELDVVIREKEKATATAETVASTLLLSSMTKQGKAFLDMKGELSQVNAELGVFSNLALASASSVSGLEKIKIGETQELKDINSELKDLQAVLLDMKAQPPTGATKIKELSLDMAEVIGKMDELKARRGDIVGKRPGLQWQSEIELMKLTRDRLEADIKKQQQSTMGVLGSGMGAPAMELLPDPFSGLHGPLEILNAEIERFDKAMARAGATAEEMVDVRGKWFSGEEIGTATQALKDSIKDYALLAETIGMTAREKEIFVAKSLGVSQATLDEAAAWDILLTKKEKDLETTERLEAAAKTLRQSFKGPVGEFIDQMDDLKRMFARGLLNLPEFITGMNKAKEVMQKGINLNVDTSKSVVGIQTALGQFKVGGAQQKQQRTQSQQLAIQTSSNAHLSAISKALIFGKGAFTP